MITATALAGQRIVSQQLREWAVPCSRQPDSRCQPRTAQLFGPVQPSAHSGGQWHRRQALVQLAGHAKLRPSRSTATQAFNDDAADRQRSAEGSGSEAVARGRAGSSGSRLGELVNSPFDADIFSVAVPALASIMLDAIMLLVDTGAAQTEVVCHNVGARSAETQLSTSTVTTPAFCMAESCDCSLWHGRSDHW